MVTAKSQPLRHDGHRQWSITPPQLENQLLIDDCVLTI